MYDAERCGAREFINFHDVNFGVPVSVGGANSVRISSGNSVSRRFRLRKLVDKLLDSDEIGHDIRLSLGLYVRDRNLFLLIDGNGD
jgi:hypothetical protein